MGYVGASFFVSPYTSVTAKRYVPFRFIVWRLTLLTPLSVGVINFVLITALIVIYSLSFGFADFAPKCSLGLHVWALVRIVAL